ncbi:MAG TPA: hemolysin family protein [Polyangiaceae bacterium]|nr:hemolysin family protein [Polyangiaceae bacterium]
MLGLLAVAAFIGLNGFFVAAEFALVKLRAERQTRGKAGPDDALARAVGKLDRYLSVTQLGITLASLGLGWVGEPAVAHSFRDVAASALGRPLGPAGENVAVGVAFTLLTFGHVLLGELVPKLAAIQRSESIARASVWPLKAVWVMLWPALWLLEASSRGILNLFGMSSGGHAEGELSEEEILGILAAYVARGRGGDDKRELLQRIVRFSQRRAKQAMIPRVDVVYLPIHTKIAKAVELLRAQQYSRVPLSKGAELDEVVGYLYWKDLVQVPPGSAAEQQTVESLQRTVLFVPESQSLVQVLRSMQTAQTPFAVVVDEYGGTSGIVTMEDLLEEIVGEIRDEFDEEGSRIEKRDGAWEVDGGVMLDELGAAFGLAADGEAGPSTVGGALLARLGRLPRVGDSVRIGNMKAEVVGISRRRVTRVRLSPVELAEGGETA